MIFLVKAISLLMMALGIAFLAKPDYMKKALAFFQQDNRVYVPGVIRITIGGVLLFAAPEAHVVGAMVILGLFFIAAGIMIFVIGPEKMKTLLKLWEEMPLWICRVVGVFPVLLGSLILYLA